MQISQPKKVTRVDMKRIGTVALAAATALLIGLVGVAMALPPTTANGTATQTGIAEFEIRMAGPNVIIEQTTVGVVSGTLSGTFEDRFKVVIHPNGRFTAQGSGSCECTANGVTGVIRYVTSDTGEEIDGIPTFEGRQVITEATGGLSGLRGVLQIEGTVDLGTGLATVSYSGAIHTHP